MRWSVPCALCLVALPSMLGACGSEAPPTTPASSPSRGAGAEVPDGSDVEVTDESEWMLEATATASSPQAAYEGARHRLAVALYGSQAWADVLDMPVHDQARDPVREVREGDAWRVHVGLTRARASELLTQAAHQPLSVEAPASLARRVERAQRLALLARLCERRAAVLEDPCGEEDPVGVEGEVDAILSELSASLRLTPRFDGGVPLGPDGRPLRPVVVHGAADGEPVAELPLVAEGKEPRASGPWRAVTGPEGTARFADVEDVAWKGPLRVEVDAERLLGPLVEAWRGDEPVRIEGRRVGLARWAATVEERGQGANAHRAVAERVLERGIRERTGGRRVKLTQGQMDRVREARRDPSVLASLADEMEGRLDVVLVVEVDSEFASRMGAQRVWYEARGRAMAFDAWGGRRLAAVEATVTESGVGEARADRAARQAVARALVEQLWGELRPSEP